MDARVKPGHDAELVASSTFLGHHLAKQGMGL